MFFKKVVIDLKKAKRPIVCYKDLYKRETLNLESRRHLDYDFVSVHYGFLFKRNKKYFSNLTKKQEIEFYKDIFSNKSLFSAYYKVPKTPRFLDTYLCKCIIPKNSLYLISPNNELVADHLIVIGVVRNERNTPEGKEEKLKREAEEENKQKRKKKWKKFISS